MRHGTVNWAPFFLIWILVIGASPALAQSDPDLAGAQPNLQLVPAGSLIIPMDNTLQSLSGTPFNMKAYGLVNSLLHSNVPVKWAIAAGKSKDGIDFSAPATQVSPVAPTQINATNFSGGPFIIDRRDTNNAWPVITNFANNVAVFQLTQDATIDIRYILSHKPKVAVMADGAFHYIQTNVLNEAGFSTNDYQVLFATNLPLVSATSCFTMVTAPHYDGGSNATAQTLAIRGFLASGGNIMCQCAAVTTYENNANGHFHTTLGINSAGFSGPCQFINADCAYNQFIGGVTNLVASSALSSWTLNSGSVLTNNAYPTVYVLGSNTPYCAVSKLTRGQPGGCMFYLGGHDYGVGSSLQHYNGRRMMLNAIFVPAVRPGECGVNFQTDLAVSQNPTVRSFTNGQTVTYTITITNQGSSRVSGAPFTDIFPTEVSDIMWSAAFSTNSSGSNTNGLGNINETFNMPIYGSVVITANGTLTTIDSCTLTNIATIAPPSSVIEANPSDNVSIHIDATAPTVSTPNAIGCIGNPATFTTATTGLGPFQFAWKKNGNLLSTNITLVITNVSTNDLGLYTIEATGACSSSATNTFTLLPDNLTAAPLTNIVACRNQQAVFTQIVSNAFSANFLWSKNGVLINGATNSSLTVAVASSSDSGTYSVVVNDGCASITNSATLYVPTTGATTILPLTRCPGQAATFTTLATGDGPFSYVWKKDGIALPGATSNSLNITNVTTTNSGLYSVEVSGPCNTVTNSANLTVRTNVSVASLGTLFCCPGQTATFKAAPVGTAPFSYRWRKNAILISGQNTSSLVLSGVTINDSGTYTVEVSGSCNSATNTGILAVGVNTTTTPMAAQTHCPLETAVFTTTPTGAGPFTYAWRRDGQIVDSETNQSLVIPNLPPGMPPTTITVEVYGQCSSATNSTSLTVENFIYVTNSITFANTNQITIVDNQPASIYPSVIHVGCLWPQQVTKVQVGILGLSHTYPSDICMMLVGPTGQATPLMVDCGGDRNLGLSGVDLTFDDNASGPVPYDSQIISTSYQPAVYSTNMTFPAPAPPSTSTTLAQFANDYSHGDWSLYVADDRIIDSGSISGGWTLTFFVTDAHAPYFVSSHIDNTGTFTTTVIGDADHPHRIEASVDTINWSAIATNMMANGSWLFTNSSPSTLLFYRAVRLPNIDP